jgi:hypothetical protein
MPGRDRDLERAEYERDMAEIRRRNTERYRAAKASKQATSQKQK